MWQMSMLACRKTITRRSECNCMLIFLQCKGVMPHAEFFDIMECFGYSQRDCKTIIDIL